METPSQETEAALLLRVQVLEIDLRAKTVENEEYRRLILSLGSDGVAAPATSVRPASLGQSSQLRADLRGPTGTETSNLETTRDRSQPQPSSSSPDRRERSIRVSRREFAVEIPSSTRPTSRFVSNSRGSPLAVDQSREPNSRNEGSGDTNGHVSASESTGSSHENLHENEAAGNLNAPQPESIQAILSGLTPYRLSWGESIRVDQTPKVSRFTLRKIFGGLSNTEWVKCNRQEGYPRLFCVKITAQPFMPTSTGSCGLILSEPAWVDTQDEEGDHMFPVFVSTSAATGNTPVEYMGDYTKVILPQKDIDWSLLSATCKRAWLKRLHRSGSPAGRALRARIRLREVLKREPSVSEVREALQICRCKDSLKWGEMGAAFRKGEEKMRIIGIQCKRYDSFLAGVLTGNQER